MPPGMPDMVEPIPKPKRVKDKRAIRRARKPYCEYCGETRLKLEVHHIEGQGRYGPGDVADNLITLCIICHGKAQRFEIPMEELQEIRGREHGLPQL